MCKVGRRNVDALWAAEAYGEGAQPVVIEVNKPGLSVHFNAWHSKVTVSGQSVTRIVAEAVFVKRVGFFFHLSL